MNLVTTVLSLFGGATNLTGVLASIGGISAIVMFLMSPLLSIVIKVNWNTQKKNVAVWVVSFGATGITMYVSHAFTGSPLDIATWLAIWPTLVAGATLMHDKIWGSDGTGISTWIENNVWPGTSIVFPTNKDQLVSDAEQIAQIIVTKILENKVGSGTVTTQAGTAGAVPVPDSAPLTGGPTIDVSTPVNPAGMAAQAAQDATQSNGTTGQSYVPEGTTLPATATATLITPSPAVQAEVDAVTNAIAAGTPVEEIASGGTE